MHDRTVRGGATLLFVFAIFLVWNFDALKPMAAFTLHDCSANFAAARNMATVARWFRMRM
jgi:hypothetical protein